MTGTRSVNSDTQNQVEGSPGCRVAPAFVTQQLWVTIECSEEAAKTLILSGAVWATMPYTARTPPPSGPAPSCKVWDQGEERTQWPHRHRALPPSSSYANDFTDQFTVTKTKRQVLLPSQLTDEETQRSPS